MRIKLISSLLALGFICFALPALAAYDYVPVIATAPQGVTSIGMQDFNHDGRIDRAVVTFANPSHATWQVHGTGGIGISYQGNPLAIRTAFIASSGDPATLEIVLVNDSLLPQTTAADGFEVTYVPQGAALGVSDGTNELAAISGGDTGSTDTELDQAAPILLSSSPAAGTVDAVQDNDVILTFSETVIQDGLVPASALGPASWNFTIEGNVVTAQHLSYDDDAIENFGIDAKDAAGNHLAIGPYPNPFGFRTGEGADPDPSIDNVFTLTTPLSLGTLQAGAPNVVAWYSNLADVTDVQLTYSADGGLTNLPIATRPRSEGTFVWYPPALNASIQLSAVGLNANGVVIASSKVNPISVSGTVAAPLSVSSGPDVVKLSPTSVHATLDLNRPPVSATVVCGSVSVTMRMSGDRPTRLEADVAGLVDGLATCRFTVNDSKGAPLVVDSQPFTVGKDAAAPVLIGPAVVDTFNAEARTARVSWTTDEPATSEVKYGVYLNFGSTAIDTQLSTTHSLALTGLTPGVLHQLRITSVDAEGNAAVTPDVFFVFLREGDLIKAKTSSAVYWYKGGKRWVFADETTYRSWFGTDFSKVITVPAAQLGTITIGGNVKMKEGAYLIKIQSDPKTYAVEPNGILRWVQTEAQANTLYGKIWNTRIRDIDVSLFVDYTIGAPLQDGEKPAGYVN